MYRFCLTCLLVTPLLGAQPEDKSGPGSALAGSFDAYNVNGKFKGRQHCLITDFGLRPTVMIFAREVPDEKEGALPKLLSDLDAAVEKHFDQQLRAAVVYVSPHARSSATDDTTEDATKLVEQARAREALLKRLEEKAKDLKNVIVAAIPDPGPKGYQLNARDAITVIFYNRLKVLARRGYAEGQLRDQDVDRIMQQVQDELKPAKKAKAE
jgi:hypothetical protein